MQEDFSLTYSEHRYQPFWHVISKAPYEYNRTTNYQIPPSGKEVKNVTLHETKYDVMNGHIHVPVLEYCLQEERDEKIIDGITGKDSPTLQQYLTMTPTEVEGQLRFDAKNGQELMKAMTEAMSPKFQVTDAGGNVVAEGTSGTDAVTLPVGTYTVRVLTSPVRTFERVPITSKQQQRIEVKGGG